MLTKENSPQLYELTKHIPARLIESAPQGKSGSYVPHYVIVQALLATVGPYDWELVEALRGRVEGTTTKKGDVYPPLEGTVVGAVYRLRCVVDGRTVTIEEPGSCESGPWETNDGERLKKASSDALKRCAMRLGVALHLWCHRDDQWFVNRVLAGGEDEKQEGSVLVGVEADDELRLLD